MAAVGGCSARAAPPPCAEGPPPPCAEGPPPWVASFMAAVGGCWGFADCAALEDAAVLGSALPMAAVGGCCPLVVPAAPAVGPAPASRDAISLARLSISLLHGPAAADPIGPISRAHAPNTRVVVFMTFSPGCPRQKDGGFRTAIFRYQPGKRPDVPSPSPRLGTLLAWVPSHDDAQVRQLRLASARCCFGDVQSALIPVASATLFHSRTCIASAAAKSCAVPVLASMPIFAKAARASADLRPSLRAWLRLLMMAGGVPAGASNPNMTSCGNPMSPTSVMVGVSGSSGQRLALVTASAFSLPALKCVNRVDLLLKSMSMCPPSRSVIIGAAPL